MQLPATVKSTSATSHRRFGHNPSTLKEFMEIRTCDKVSSYVLVYHIIDVPSRVSEEVSPSGIALARFPRYTCIKIEFPLLSVEVTPVSKDGQQENNKTGYGNTKGSLSGGNNKDSNDHVTQTRFGVVGESRAYVGRTPPVSLCNSPKFLKLMSNSKYFDAQYIFLPRWQQLFPIWWPGTEFDA
eukprot:jgi/Psemu1/59665/gm1.59665_g